MIGWVAAPAAGAGPLSRGERAGLSILGTRVLRVEDPRFLTTGGVYTEDVQDDRLAVVDSFPIPVCQTGCI